MLVLLLATVLFFGSAQLFLSLDDNSSTISVWIDEHLLLSSEQTIGERAGVIVGLLTAVFLVVRAVDAFVLQPRRERVLRERR